MQLFQAFDAAIRGLTIGGTTTLEAKGGEWRRDLLFEVLPTTCDPAVTALRAHVSQPVPALENQPLAKSHPLLGPSISACAGAAAVGGNQDLLKTWDDVLFVSIHAVGALRLSASCHGCVQKELWLAGALTGSMHQWATRLQVPRTHPEIERLEGRYRSQGGLKEGMLVELANSDTALVVALGEASVRLDANNMMAGKSRVFELELVALERGQ